MMVPLFRHLSLLALCIGVFGRVADPPCGNLGNNAQLIPPPANASRSAAEQATWLGSLRTLRCHCRAALGLDSSNASLPRPFDEPSLAWTQSAYVQAQMHPMDRYFFDGPSGNRSYTVTRFLDDLRARYGGVDGLLVWNTYPHLGFDDRNAFDLIRLLPGGLAGIRGFVASSACSQNRGSCRYACDFGCRLCGMQVRIYQGLGAR